MIPAVRVAHHVEGRTRLQADPALAHDDRFVERVTRELADVPGVAGLRVNRRTGSIVVEHDAPLSKVADAARRRGLFAVAPVDAGPPAPAPVPAKRPKSSGLSLGAVGFFSLGLYQVMRGDVLPAALPLLMQGWMMLREGRQLPPAEEA